MAAYSINPVSGALARLDADPATPAIDDFQAGNDPWAVAVDPGGKHVYVTNFAGRSVSGYTINTGTGALTRIDANPTTPAIDDFPAGESPFQVAVHPNGRFAYVVNFGAGNQPGSISLYAVDPATGALARIDADPTTPATVDDVAFTRRPAVITFDQQARFAYVAFGEPGNWAIRAFSVDSTTGRLVQSDANAATPAVDDARAGGADPRSIAIAPSGRFAYVSNADTATVTIYSIDATTGALTAIDNHPVGPHPWSVAIARGGKFAYAACIGSGSISPAVVSAHAVDPATGGLTRIDADATTPAVDDITAVNRPRSLAFERTQRFIYVAGSIAVHAFSLDAATGALTPIGDLPVNGDTSAPYGIAVASPP